MTNAIKTVGIRRAAAPTGRQVKSRVTEHQFAERPFDGAHESSCD